MAYAQHQSFYLRANWISKGLKFVKQDKRFFYDKYAFEKIGLGKNMVQSLKFWLFATGLIEEVYSDGQKIHQLTELGNLIYEKDRLLQYNDTLSILHFNLIRNINDQSTVFDWFFNTYIETKTRKEELLDSFMYWVKNKEGKDISNKSLKRDVECLISLYTKGPNENDPEDITFSPLNKLNLLKIQRSSEGYTNIFKNNPLINDIGITALYYTLLVFCEDNNLRMINVDEIIKGRLLWGKVFNFTRSNVIETLNLLTNYHIFPLQYDRTNNLDNVIIPKVSPMEFLYLEYKYEGGKNYGI